jgi:hypothetical protein
MRRKRIECVRDLSLFLVIRRKSMMFNTVDVPEILEAFKRSLHAEDASSNTTSAYLSDLTHFQGVTLFGPLVAQVECNEWNG